MPFTLLVKQTLEPKGKVQQSVETKPKNYKTKYLTQDVIDKMFALRKEGMSYAEISRKLNLSYRRVRDRLVSGNTVAYNSLRGNVALEKELVKLRRQGLSYANIAKKTNQNYESVRSVLLWLGEK